MTTQSEIFESYVHDIKYRLMLAKRIIFDDANSDWPDDAIAAFFKARFECVGDPIYRDCVKRLATAFVSNPANEERFDLYAKRADRVLKTEVSNVVRSACKDMVEIKKMLGLKPDRKYRHSEVLDACMAKITDIESFKVGEDGEIYLYANDIWFKLEK